MDAWMTTVFQAIGGIGVFLLALDMLTQGLRMASGNALQSLLSRWSDTPLRGLSLGFAATAVLQSSSVVTALVIGLVNAAIMPLNNAVWTVFGANIGTTLTGWLVSATGFDVNLKALALPFVGFGMLLKILARRAGWKAAGMALAGIGLFFVGIDFLKDAFSAYAGAHDFGAIDQTGFSSLLGLVGAGLVMTVVIQSSTAAMVIILTGAATGMLTLSGGAALVIGANLGTTPTALIAAIGASPNAKRTSAVHVIFNVVTAAVVLPLLPFVLAAIEKLEILFGTVPNVAFSLAVFHTAFSVIGVVIFWPFVPALTRFLQKCFAAPVEKDSQPKFLDRTVIGLPAAAVGMLSHELLRLQRKTAQHCLRALTGDDRNLQRERDALLALSGEITSFAAALAQENADADTSENLQSAFRINRHLALGLNLSGAARSLHKTLAALPATAPDATATAKLLQRMTQLCGTLARENHLPPRARQTLLRDYRAAKDLLLHAGVRHETKCANLSALLDDLSQTHRMAEQLTRADRRLARLLPPAKEEKAPVKADEAAVAA